MDTGDDDTFALRGALRWQANNNFEINISGDYSRDRENGQVRVTTQNPDRIVDLTPGANIFTHNFLYGANSPLNPANGGPGLNNPGTPIAREFNNCDATPANIAGTTSGCANANTIALGKNTSTMPTYSDHDVYGFSGTIDWQISDNLEIKSITAYRNVDSTFAHDGDSTPFFLSWVRDEIYVQEQFTQEIQLLGTAFADRLQWIIGGFYFTEDGNNYNPVDFVHLDIESGAKFDPTVFNTGGPAKGDRLPQVPRWSLAASLIKEFGLGDMGTIIARLDYNYRTKVFFDPANDPGSVMQSHGLMNASVGWDSANDKYSLIFHANNIFDKRRIIYTELSGSARTQNDVLARDFAWYLTGEYRF